MHFKTDRKKVSQGIMQSEYYPSFSSSTTACITINHTHYYFTIIIALSCELDVISV
jgi:hypothetical protein